MFHASTPPRRRLMSVLALTSGAFLWMPAAPAQEPPTLEAEIRAGYPPMPEGKPPVLEVENAAVNCEADMKPYTEVIPGTEVTFDMVPIPGGTFMMGSPEDEEDRGKDEGPRIEVVIEPLWMGKYEVTWAQYKIFMEKWDIELRKRGQAQPTPQDPWADAVSRPTPLFDPSYTYQKGQDPNHPAVCMTQLAARQFSKWITMKTGRFYRLPTEAEWEYAARAGTTTAYSFGADADELDDHAWYFDNAENEDGDGVYFHVGTKKPNPWGLYDMHGNVGEWVMDQYDAKWYEQFAGKGPVNYRKVINWPTVMYPRVVRGGSWDHEAEELRSAARHHSESEWKVRDPQFPKSIWWFTDAQHVGMRLVRPLQEPGDEEKQRYWEPDLDEVRTVYERQRRGER